MSRRIMLIPVGTSVGLTTVSMGLVRAIEEQGIKLNFLNLLRSRGKATTGKSVPLLLSRTTLAYRRLLPSR